jgi:hypothetical protein
MEVTLDTPQTSLTHGLTIKVQASGANNPTAPCTLNVDGLGANSVLKGAGAALAVDDVGGATHIMLLIFSTSANAWIIVNPASEAAGGGGATSLIELTDTPAALGTTGEMLVVDAAGTSTEWVVDPDWIHGNVGAAFDTPPVTQSVSDWAIGDGTATGIAAGPSFAGVMGGDVVSNTSWSITQGIGRSSVVSGQNAQTVTHYMRGTVGIGATATLGKGEGTADSPTNEIVLSIPFPGRAVFFTCNAVVYAEDFGVAGAFRTEGLLRGDQSGAGYVIDGTPIVTQIRNVNPYVLNLSIAGATNGVFRLSAVGATFEVTRWYVEVIMRHVAGPST